MRIDIDEIVREGVRSAAETVRLDVLGGLTLMECIEKVQSGELVRVIRCKDCGHCFELAATDPLTPYHGGKEGFYCEAWDTDFYTTHYNPETYYCADAKPRAAEQPAGLYANKDPFQDVLMPAT